MPDNLPDHFYMPPSAAHRWTRCSASLRHMDEAPEEDDENFKADRGTLGHLFVAEWLTGEKPDAGWIQFWEQSFDKEERSILLDAVQMCIGYLQELQDAGFELVSEIKLQDDMIEEHGGTIDIIAIHHKRKIIQVVDFKFGQLGVDIEDNRQVMCYLVLVRQWLEPTDDWQFFGTIIQPAVGGVMTQEFTYEQLDEHSRVVLWASLTHEYHPGTHCDYCPIVHKCIPCGEWMQQQARNEFPDLTGFATGLDCELPDEHEAATLVAMYKTAKIAEKICKKAGTLIKTYEARGHKFNGVGVRSKTYMHWLTDHSAESIAHDYELTEGQYMIPGEPLSPAAMAGLLGMTSKQFREKHADRLKLTEQKSLHTGRVGVQDFPEFSKIPPKEPNT